MSVLIGFEKIPLTAVIVSKYNKHNGTLTVASTRYWSPVSDLPVKLVFSLEHAKGLSSFSIDDIVTLSVAPTLAIYRKFLKPRAVALLGSENDWVKTTLKKRDAVYGVKGSPLIVSGIISTAVEVGDKVLFCLDLIDGGYKTGVKSFMLLRG